MVNRELKFTHLSRISYHVSSILHFLSCILHLVSLPAVPSLRSGFIHNTYYLIIISVEKYSD